MTFRIWVALESLQYLDNHEPQHFDFCIECTQTHRTCQLYHHQVKIMFIYEGTDNLVSGAFLKFFSIYINNIFTMFNSFQKFKHVMALVFRLAGSLWLVTGLYRTKLEPS